MTGITDADLIVFVTLRPTQNNVYAWAIGCLEEEKFGRTVVAQLNISPLLLDEDYRLQMGVAMHELVHALGFSSSRFDDYIDFYGNKRQQVTKIDTLSFIDSAGNTQNKSVMYLITPEVVNQARKHFNCNDITGVPLEEWGVSGTYASHFEKRLFLNEIMTGSVGWFNPSASYAISQFTLAILEDSGWYRANWTRANVLLWGKNTGCAIPFNRCENWNLDHLESHYCTNPGAPVCTFNLRGKGFCNVQRYSNDLGYYRHLSNPNWGGPDNLMDYCPFSSRLDSGECSDTTSKNGNRYAFEYYGTDSGCFESNVQSPGNVNSQDTRCFRYKCDNTSRTLVIVFQDTEYRCPSDESYQKITTLPAGFNGYIACPRLGYSMLCSVADAKETLAGCTTVLGLFCSSSVQPFLPVLSVAIVVIVSLLLG
jgi:leishmanolysin